MASVTGTPLVYLTGITPSGLNASSDGEIRVFEDWCSAQQEGYTPHVSRIINLIQLSLYGEIDPSIGFRWMPLHTQSENDLSNARKQDADTDAVLIGAGVISQEEARARVASQEDSPYNGLDLSEPLPEVPEPESGPEAKAEKISGQQQPEEETEKV